jgi:hypothetical protein
MKCEYFKTWIIWNKSLLTIRCIFNFFHLLLYQWKLNNKIMDSCIAKYNHLGYLTILHSIGIPSFNQLIHQKMLIWPSKIFCTKFVFKSTYTKIHHQYWEPKSNSWITCFIFFNCRKNNCKSSIGERPFSSIDVEPFIQSLSLFFDMRPKILYNFDDAFEIG